MNQETRQETNNYKDIINNSDLKTSLFGYNKSQVDVKFKDLNIYCGRITAEYDSIVMENEELTKECEELREKLNIGDTEIHDLQRENDSLNDKIADLNQQVSDLRSLIGLNINREHIDNDITSQQPTQITQPTEPTEQSIQATYTEPIINEPPKTSSLSLKSDDDNYDEDVFVGEIEDNRTPERIMIGDGSDSESNDFEFI